MSDQQANRSAFPDPPNYFKRFTNENLALLKQAKKSDVFSEAPTVLPDVPEFKLEALDPPIPPTSEYTIFDQKWQVMRILDSLVLKSNGIKLSVTNRLMIIYQHWTNLV